MENQLKHEEVEALFRVEASLRSRGNRWLYGKEIASLLEQGLLAECNDGLQITPKGRACLLLVRNGPMEE